GTGSTRLDLCDRPFNPVCVASKMKPLALSVVGEANGIETSSPFDFDLVGGLRSGRTEFKLPHYPRTGI
ncbi:MAG: hypothetical protein KGQ32_10580, partial [Xanthomonadaceae bacterium]|nr:hypothetical protein [Xanthomonadaceae bacterium]